MKKRVLEFGMLGIMGVLCLTMSGCQRSGNESIPESVYVDDPEETQDKSGSQIPQSYRGTLSSGVQVDAEINVPSLLEEEHMGIYSGSFFHVETEKLAKALMPNTDWQYEEHPGDGGEGILHTYTDCSGLGKMYSMDDICLSYSSDLFEKVRTNFEMDNEVDEEYSFASKESANQEIRKTFTDVGLAVGEEYECTAMDYQRLKELNLQQFAGFENDPRFMQEKEELENIPWSADMDCYVFTFHAVNEGVPLGTDNREINGVFIPGSFISVTYTKRGIEKLEISNLYKADEKMEEGKLLGLEDALAIIDEKYHSIILDGVYEISSVSLVYIADVSENKEDEFTLIPAWKFTIIQNYAMEDKVNKEKEVAIEQENTVYINAVTGKEIVSGGC